MNKLIRITTVPISLDKLIEGQMSYMKDHFEVLAISSASDTLDKVGKKEGVATLAVEMTRKITLIKDLSAVFSLVKIFRQYKPQIVHTHTPKAGIVGMLAAYIARVPVRMHTVAGLPLLESQGLKRLLLNTVEKLTYVFATRVYPNSFVLKEIILKNRFCKLEKLKVIANGSTNGINTSYFNPELYSKEDKESMKRSLGICKNEFVFIFVGRLVSDKGLNELINAFHKLTSQQTNVKLLLLGSLEDELDPLEEQTKAVIQNNQQITALGFKSDVRPYFSIADALVFPSYREGFPNVVMQAGAMGLPSIVSNINGCNEIIEHNKNGIIIPVKNTTTLFKSMNQMLNNSKLRTDLENNARAMICSRFEQKLVWDALLTEYKNQIANVQ
jgi:glycosyltransferase involved in cell wall biosynthesis